jgi:MFS superfamily sulfate permease-like transporter
VCWLSCSFESNTISNFGWYFLVGYKLANPKTIIHFWKKDKIYQFIPLLYFIAVVATDLLRGVALGMIINIILF